ncbi:MAG: NUDIX domain-containing protein [Bacteroidetes bacterium]|nr:NUDIX domain-containing protein [Bacteroidota bacterium]
MDLGYKIYFNHSILQLSNSSKQSKEFSDLLLTKEASIEKFFSDSVGLFDGSLTRNVHILTKKPEYWMQELKKKVKLIIAGGGIVWNEHGELLMIYRKGMWDLPKGKIEPDENIQAGAQREVEEETGVIIQSATDKFVKTYHTYQMNGKNCLKETSWFEMSSYPNQNNLKPQTQEGITEARWVKKVDLENYQKDSYPLISDLIGTLIGSNI